MKFSKSPEYAKVQLVQETSATDERRSSSSLYSLTSLRFFAAYFIVIYHSQSQFPYLHGLAGLFSLEQTVSFFFILSGFILTYSYKELSLENPWSYFRSRFFRIYPVHIAALLTLFALMPQNMEVLSDWKAVIPYLTMTQAWIPIQKYYFTWNSPSWSISSEWFFFLSLPLLLTLGRLRVWLPLVVTAATLCLSFLLVGFLALPTFSEETVSAHGVLYIGPLSRIFEFALGVTAALLRGRLTANRYPSLLELSSLATLLITCHLSTKVEHLLPFALPAGFLMWATHAGFAALPAVAVIYIFSQERGLVSRALRVKPLVLLGEVSFSMYMLHYILLCYKFETLPLIHNSLGFLGFSAILILGSYFTFTFIETPARNLFKKKPPTEGRHNQTKPLLLLLLPLLIYAIVPGTTIYESDIKQGKTIPFAPINFDDRIELKQISRCDRSLVCRFMAMKNQVLFDKAELQLLDDRQKPVNFLLSGLTARPEYKAQGDCFDLKFPLSESGINSAAYLSVRLIEHSGGSLPALQQKVRQKRALIELRENPTE